jgi:4-alpha-glucanotransferase
MKLQRSSGILLPIFSLPSKYGVGTLGQAAYDFIDFLADADQAWWQILPVGPTSYGDSPYQCYSTFAGNPYFVDLDLLVEDGLLKKSELKGVDFGDDPSQVDYAKLFENRFPLLRKAFARGRVTMAEEFADFRRENQRWLDDYALFMAAKDHFGGKPWTEWPDDDLRMHRPDAVRRYMETLAEDVEFYSFVQLLFFRQWDAMHAYALDRGVGIIGDLPIYVAMDSADTWSSPESFQLDDQNVPTAVSGVPPDYFSEDGQLWGTPLYRWDAMRADGYGWWIRRVEGAAKLYDALRIDHFRGFEAYWSVPYGDKTAKNGKWVKGPGMDLVGRLTGWFHDVQFIAEDLGFITPELQALLTESGLPGMKVLEFAFDSREPSNYLPHTYGPNCICYTGTHDNTTLAAWRDEADPDDVAFADEYLGLNDEEGRNIGMIRGGMSSVAVLFVAQLQDWLNTGAESRINTPGKLGGNWLWRLQKDELPDDLAEKIARMTRNYGRRNPHPKKETE